MIDIWGICVGRYAKKNHLTPKEIDASLEKLPPIEGIVEENQRREYGAHYREKAGNLQTVPRPQTVASSCSPPETERQEIIVLGDAGQRIITAGDLLCFAGLSAGLHVTQKNEYNITVLRGPSISEVIHSPETIGYTGIESPNVLIAVGQEGVNRRAQLFEQLHPEALVIRSHDVTVPRTPVRTVTVDFRTQNIRGPERALAALGILAKLGNAITPDMLRTALSNYYRDPILASSLDLVDRVERNG